MMAARYSRKYRESKLTSIDMDFANKICYWWFTLNISCRPSKDAVIEFAKEHPSLSKILHWLAPYNIKNQAAGSNV